MITRRAIYLAPNPARVAARRVAVFAVTLDELRLSKSNCRDCRSRTAATVEVELSKSDCQLSKSDCQ